MSDLIVKNWGLQKMQDAWPRRARNFDVDNITVEFDFDEGFYDPDGCGSFDEPAVANIVIRHTGRTITTLELNIQQFSFAQLVKEIVDLV